MIQVRYSTSPSSVETAPTADLRENYLVHDLFAAGEVHAVYTHEDRLVVGGAVPGRRARPAGLDRGPRHRVAPRGRELGIINVGEAGHVLVDGRSSSSTTSTACSSAGGARCLRRRRGRLLLRLRPRPRDVPTPALSTSEVEPVALGSADARQRAQPLPLRLGPGPADPCSSSASPSSPTAPCGTPSRRTCTPPHRDLLYVDLDEDDRVFHFLGQPGPPGTCRRQPPGRHLPAVVDPRRRRHRLLRLHLGDGRREQRLHRPQPGRGGGPVSTTQATPELARPSTCTASARW